MLSYTLKGFTWKSMFFFLLTLPSVGVGTEATQSKTRSLPFGFFKVHPHIMSLIYHIIQNNYSRVLMCVLQCYGSGIIRSMKVY